MKKQTLKIKKYTWLAYNAESNFITNGSFAMDASYLNYDNDLISDKVCKKQGFIKDASGINDSAKTPKINNLVDLDAIQNFYLATNTGLMSTFYEGKKKQIKHFFKLNATNEYSTIDDRIYSLLPDDIDLKCYAKNNASAHYITTSNGELIALLMPITFEGNEFLKVL